MGTSLEEKLTVVSHSDRWTESKLTVAEVYHNGGKVRVRGEGKRGAVVQSQTEMMLTLCVCVHLMLAQMSELASTVFQVPQQCHLGPGKTDEIKVSGWDPLLFAML